MGDTMVHQPDHHPAMTPPGDHVSFRQAEGPNEPALTKIQAEFLWIVLVLTFGVGGFLLLWMLPSLLR